MRNADRGMGNSCCFRIDNMVHSEILFDEFRIPRSAFRITGFRIVNTCATKNGARTMAKCRILSC
jgi:hypothetical protein